MSNQQREWIRAEITQQLIELKSQLNREIVEDMGKLRKQIMEEVDKKIKLVSEDIANKVNSAADKQIVCAEAARRDTKDLVLAIGQQVQTCVYNRVLNDINEKIVPEVDRMVQWVNFNMQDGTEVVTQYRRAVDKQTSSSKRLVGPSSDVGENVVSENVRMFFTESD